MGLIEFVIPGVPVAKARARTVRRKNNVWSFTPAKTIKYENHVMKCASHYSPKTLIDFPVKVTCEFHIPKPKKNKRAYPVTRPDIDNYLKCILDGCNGVLWKDDSFVCEVNMKKIYALNEPKTLVKIELL